MMNRKPQAQDQNYARQMSKPLPAFFPPFLNSLRTKMNEGHDEVPLFFP